MERIVIEVNGELAKAWRKSTPEFREKLEKDIEARIADTIREAERVDFFNLLDTVQNKAASKRLTQETLEEILEFADSSSF